MPIPVAMPSAESESPPRASLPEASSPLSAASPSPLVVSPLVRRSSARLPPDDEIAWKEYVAAAGSQLASPTLLLHLLHNPITSWSKRDNISDIDNFIAEANKFTPYRGTVTRLGTLLHRWVLSKDKPMKECKDFMYGRMFLCLARVLSDVLDRQLLRYLTLDTAKDAIRHLRRFLSLMSSCISAEEAQARAFVEDLQGQYGVHLGTTT